MKGRASQSILQFHSIPYLIGGNVPHRDLLTRGSSGALPVVMDTEEEQAESPTNELIKSKSTSCKCKYVEHLCRF